MSTMERRYRDVFITIRTRELPGYKYTVQYDLTTYNGDRKLVQTRSIAYVFEEEDEASAEALGEAYKVIDEQFARDDDEAEY